MRRLLPRSLIGQIALIMAGALLIAQAINFTLILSERQRVSRVRTEGPAIARFASFAQRIAPLGPRDRAIIMPPPRHRTRLWLSTASAIPPGGHDAQITERLFEAAAESGLPVRQARALSPDEPPRRRMRPLLLSLQLPDGSWLNGHLLLPRPDPWIAIRAAIATLLTYLIILAAMVWMAVRLARPLRNLTAAAERFEGRGEPPHVEPTGPEDLKRAIEAFNGMGSRVSAMLDEKDRMLGAIGHDLRTPLASLRIRAESVEPEEERDRMIATIEEMTAMLDDTLALARSGRAVEKVRLVDLTALADTVVEEYRALGKPVEMAPGSRLTANVQPNLLRRGIRNLVENAVTYAGSATVEVRRDGEWAVISVADRGPGIAEGELARVMEPFYRTDPSRNRETGGTGLGLTLARSSAQAHGGSLELENRPGGGLRATIRVPKAD